VLHAAGVLSVKCTNKTKPLEAIKIDFSQWTAEVSNVDEKKFVYEGIACGAAPEAFFSFA
jgi:hypothetical protein